MNKINKLEILKTTRSGNVSFMTILPVDDLAFAIKGKGVYGWVWFRDYKRHLETGEPLESIKIGEWGTEAKDGMLVHETIDSYSKFTTDAVVIVYARKFSDFEMKTKLPNGKLATAYNVEQALRKSGDIGNPSKYGTSTEVYLMDDYSSEKLDGLIDSLLYPDMRFTLKDFERFTMRESQQECYEKALSWFRSMKNSPPFNFLMGAVMSFGKSFVFLNVSKTILDEDYDGVGNLLVFTSKPAIFDSVEEDVKTHILFNDWNIIKVKDVKMKLSLPKDKVNVVMVSTQLLNHENNVELVKLLSKFEFVNGMIDEAHAGILTEKSLTHIETINCKYSMYVTGTPWKLENYYLFKDKLSKFIYDYFDQAKEAEKNPNSKFVKLIGHAIDVPKSIKQESMWDIDSGEGYTMEKQFAFDNKLNQWLHPKDQIDLWTMILNPLGSSNPKVAKRISPYEIANINHVFSLVPANLKMIEKLVDDVNYIISKYNLPFKIFNASGNHYKDIDVLKIEIEKYEKLDIKTITFSCGRFAEGVGVPLWDGMFHMTDTESLELYFQSGWRPTRWKIGKMEAHIFDFNPNRMFKNMGTYILEKSTIQGNDPKQIITEYLDYFPMYRYGEEISGLKIVSYEDIITTIRKTSFRSSYFTQTPLKQYLDIDRLFEMFTLDELSDILEGAPTYTQEKETYKLKENQVSKGKNYKQQTKKNPTLTSEEEKEQKKFVKQIKTLFAKLPALNKINGDFTTLDKIIKNFDEKTFHSATKVKKSFLVSLTNCMDSNKTKKVNVRLLDY